MTSDSLAGLIQSLASDLIMADENCTPDEWRQIGGYAEKAVEILIAQDMVSTADAANNIALICKEIAEGKVVEYSAALKQINHLFALVQAAGDGKEVDTATLKQTTAQATLYLQDLSRDSSQHEKAQSTVSDDLLDEIEQRVDSLEQMLFSAEGGSADPEVARTIFREIHTLKGEAGIVGLGKLSEFCHKIESAVEDARHGKLLFSANIVESLFEPAQLARQILREDEKGPVDESRVDFALQKLNEAVANGGEPAAAAPAPQSEQAASEEAEDDDDDFFADAATGDEWEDFPTKEEPQATTDVPPTEAEPLPEKEPEKQIEPPCPIQTIAPETTVNKSDTEKPIQDEELHNVTISVHLLDRLISLAGEVSLIGGSLSANENIQNNQQLSGEVLGLTRACKTMQEVSAQLRMTPIRPLFNRVRRAIYDCARQRGKKIEVSLEGLDTAVDRSVIHELATALIHMARNAVDHGIESPEERRAVGKPEKGLIKLSAFRSGSDAVIEMSENGKGLDLNRIREKAIDSGIISPDTELSEKETIDLIFSAGLSTARNVTGLSGRGVGMEAVKESVDKLRGRIEVKTTQGKGTNVQLKIPVALSAIEGVMGRVGDSIFVFPVESVRESFRVKEKDINTIEERGTIVTIRGVVLPVLFLGKELNITADSDDITDGVLVMLESNDNLCAVLVDEIMDTHQVTIHALEGELASIPSVSGAAFLPDRKVALVVDPEHLLRDVSVNAKDAFNRASDNQVSSERKVETVNIGSNQVGMIDFSISIPKDDGKNENYLFAINAFKAREFVRAEELTPLPHAPDGFAGMLMLREKTIPVVTLADLLELSPSKRTESSREWEKIIVICEFSGKTVGFLVSAVNRVSYISWNDIMPPPNSGGTISMSYIVGTILASCLGDRDTTAKNEDGDKVAFLLDFERIVQNVMMLYEDIDESLTGVQKRKSSNRILLVEDSSLIRKQTKIALENAGMDVIEAGDGQEAMDIITDLEMKAMEKGESIFNYLDLILSDIEMPRLDGYTLTASIKQHPHLRVLPILLHSSLTNETMIKRANEVHADGFVAKCDPKELADQLKKYL